MSESLPERDVNAVETGAGSADGFAPQEAPEAAVTPEVESAPEPVPVVDARLLPASDAAVLAASRRQTRRSFAAAALSAAAGYGVYRWIEGGPILGKQPLVLRRTIQAEAALSKALFNERALAPTYPISRAEKPRTNGFIGLKDELLTKTWRLQMVGVADAKAHPQYVSDVTAWEYGYAEPEASGSAPGVKEIRAGATPRGIEEAGLSASTLPAGTPGLLLTIEDVLKFPRHELVTEFKCIEGWSQILHWAGVRMADFLEAYPPARNPDGSEPRYVYMETPNGDYYVGYDLHVCRHPQTLLVTEMDGAPLTQVHGAPLRLHAPTKYGYKQIKRIGLIAYSNRKPDDYWTKLGYDWYAGL
jgi:DMSO/TMAO reductase YedYZ molybdopterin-dependent catalytic subunit